MPPAWHPLPSLLDAGRAFLDGVVRLVYPSTCWVCGVPMNGGAALVCPGCAAALTRDPHPTCPRCSSSVGPHTLTVGGCPECRAERFAFDGALRLGPYAGLLREVILRMKRRTGEDLAEAVGALWAGHAAEPLHAVGADAVVPIPLHWLRRWRCGFNQSEILARALGKTLHIPCEPGWLRRARRTPLQTRQTAAARRENVRGAFRAKAGLSLRGRTVLLVDDVLTTGATASEAARALRNCEPRRILVAVLAHGS